MQIHSIFIKNNVNNEEATNNWLTMWNTSDNFLNISTKYRDIAVQFYTSKNHLTAFSRALSTKHSDSSSFSLFSSTIDSSSESMTSLKSSAVGRFRRTNSGPTLLVKVDVWDEIIVDSSLLSSYQIKTKKYKFIFYLWNA